VTNAAADSPAREGLRVLVTGGSGFVGRNVVARLLTRGHDVVVADHQEHDGNDEVKSVVGDLCDPAVREQAVTDDVDAIVHLAAATSVLGSIERPAEVHRTNVEMTAGLLEAARQRGVGTFVLASTNAVTGDVGQSTITEDVRLAPLTPYGATKAASEMLLSGYAGAYGLRAPALRFSNVYGEGMGHKDSLIPRLMRAALSGDEIEVFGDGEQRRDLVHASDIAQAVALAVEGWPTGPVIVGGGRSYTVNELIEAAREATGRPIGTRNVPAKPGEMPAVVVDISRARSLGYEPQVSLIDGMRGVWRDFALPPDARD
jgi:UDP-glucose 4-epimerase